MSRWPAQRRRCWPHVRFAPPRNDQTNAFARHLMARGDKATDSIRRHTSSNLLRGLTALRQTSSTVVPSSACGRMNAICRSLNRDTGFAQTYLNEFPTYKNREFRRRYERNCSSISANFRACRLTLRQQTLGPAFFGLGQIGSQLGRSAPPRAGTQLRFKSGARCQRCYCDGRIRS